MAGGRPTKYNEEALAMANEYVHGGWMEMAHAIPSAPRLALLLGVNKTTLYEWASKHPEFSNVLDDMNAAQEATLLDNGLLGEYNSNIVKLVLGKHGYSEKMDQNLTSTDGSMRPTVIEVVGVTSSHE